jgi:hypothetical protein
VTSFDGVMRGHSGIELRGAVESDWPAILRCAEAAAPWAGDANITWLANRRAFAEARRRHYVATDAATIVGYGAIEGDESSRWRVFVVMAPARLEDGTGDLVFRRLMEDVRSLGGGVTWMREEARDAAILSFAHRHGFTERRRHQWEGIEIVMMERAAS